MVQNLVLQIWVIYGDGVVLILIDQFGDGSKPSFAYLGYLGYIYIYIDGHPFDHFDPYPIHSWAQLQQ